MSNNEPEVPGTEVPVPAVEILLNTNEETVTMSKGTLCEAITVASIGASK